MKKQKIRAVGLVLAGMFLALLAPRIAAAQDDDPPSRIARLNYSSGSVSFQPGGEGDWVQAVTNRPMTTGDNLWADKDSRAELHVGSTAIGMDAETSLTFLDLDDRTTQIRLSQGSLFLRVRHLDDGDNFEVDTPNLAFQVLRTGQYRIDVNPDGNETIATVWSGRGEATGGGNSYTVIAGQRSRFSGTDQLDHEIEQLPGRDAFDQWAFSRDQREEHSESANYISAEMTGYEDLDDYGRWRYVANYGTVWAPVGIAAGWAPYRFGHWVWIQPWGWTWVEDEPWGFAPFHYGRWAFVEGGWCWVPGPVVVRPVYAPALVAFVGGGGFHLSIAIGGGPGVAWFPLAPGEVYVPPYRVSRGYVNNVNITNTRVNVTQITNVYNVYNNNTTNGTRITYVNQRVPTAVTAVSRDTFVNARPVARNLTPVDAKQIAEAPVTHREEIEPVKASVLGAGRPMQARPPARVLERQVVAIRNPAPARAPVEPRDTPANVRPETPEQPQPGARGQNEMPRPGNQTPRPEGSATRGSDDSRPDARPGEAGQPRPVPRPPASNGNAPSVRSQDEDRPAPRPNADNQRNPASPHPLVREAPPVQDKPERQQSEENKFRQWQAQRPKAEPKPPAAKPKPPKPEPQKDAPKPPPHP